MMVSRFFLSLTGGFRSQGFPQNKVFIMKKLFSVCLCLTIWSSAFGQDFYVDGIYYNFIGNNQVEVTYLSNVFNSYSGDVTIPSSVTYNNVTYSVTSIGDHAFYKCSGLTSVTIPNSVTSIGTSIFYDCGLSSIIVEAGNTHYDSRNNCNAIIETSTNSLIAGCMNTVIPNSVTSIGSHAFSGCRGLTSVTIPNSVTSIGSGAFSYCSGLTSVTIPNSVTLIEGHTFRGCSSLTSVTIPNSVTTIYEYAFESCDKLVTVSIPNSVISIGSLAFDGCYNLAVINCYATIPPAIREHTFGKYDATLYVPANSVGLYQSRDYWKNFFIMPIQEDGLEYSLADRNVDYLNGRIYNENGLEIKLYDAAGRLVAYSDGDIDMSNCPNGIYIVTDNKGGSLKIVHRR